MAANKKIRFGPVAVTNAVTNIVNPTITSLAGPVGYTQTQPYVLFTHMRWVNKTASVHTISAFIGATGGSAAGTEVIASSTSVPANSALDYYPSGGLRLDAADFLTMIADANTSIVFEAEGEIGIS